MQKKSVSYYLSKVFKKTSDACEEELDKEMTSTRQLKSDFNARDPNKAWTKRRKYLKSTKVVPVDCKAPIRDDCVRFVCISDTHAVLEKHRNMDIPDGDILVHAGDLTMYGEPDEVHLVNNYLGTLPHKHKVVIAGNHDNTFDLELIRKRRSTHIWSLNADNYDSRLKAYNVTSVSELMTNCIYLQDSGVEIYGIKIYGSPWTAGHGTWGFQRRAGPALMEKWNKIPNNTDVLITHSPPCGYGDNVASLSSTLWKLTGQSDHADHVGSVDLLNTVNSRVKPQYHIFGHIHEGYGMYTDGTTMYINASTCNRTYAPVNPPIVFDIPLPDGHLKDEKCVSRKQDEDDLWVDSDLKEYESETVVAQSVGDLYDWLSYRPDGKTNCEKLTLDKQLEVDNDSDVDDSDVDADNDVDDDSDVDADNDVDDNTYDDDNDVDDNTYDDDNGDNKKLEPSTSGAVGGSMNKLILGDKIVGKLEDTDSDCEIVFDDNVDYIQMVG